MHVETLLLTSDREPSAYESAFMLLAGLGLPAVAFRLVSVGPRLCDFCPALKPSAW